MRMLLFLLAAVLYAVGGVFMKRSEGLTRLGDSVVLFGLFCAAAACQAVGMRRAEMGTSYILVLGLEAVTALGLGVWILGDRLTLPKVAAVVLIVGGIVLLRQA